MRKLEAIIGKKLKNRKQTLAIAESCTGGLIAHKVTTVSGSSCYFLGGVIAYDNSIKENLLKVSKSILKNEGAVSEKAALAMVAGVRRLFSSHVSLASTGIAGPAGGTKQKPVGLVFIALSDGRKKKCEKKVFKGSRLKIKEQAAQWALTLLDQFLE